MEKFSRWSDLSTGINPFVPVKKPLASNIVLKYVFIYPFGSLLSVIRLILASILCLAYAVTTVLVWPLQWIPGLGWALQRTLDCVWCSCLLLVFSIRVTTEAANGRRLGLESKASTVKGDAHVRAKDLILANHTNVFEILLLTLKYSPRFVFFCASNASAMSEKGFIHECGTLSAMCMSLSLPLGTLSKPQKFIDVVKHTTRPLVIFPEGTRTNGKGILHFHSVLATGFQTLVETHPALLRIHLLGFRYDTSKYNLTHPVGSSSSFLFWRSFFWFYNITVVVLPCSLVPHVPTSKAPLLKEKDALGNRLPANIDQWLERIRNLFGSMLRTKVLGNLTAADHVTFLQYWHHVTNGGKDPASNFTERMAPHEHAQWKTRST